MQQQRRARLAAAAAAAAIVLLVSLTILDIRNPLEALGFIYHNVHPSVGYSRYASTAYPRAFIPRVALPLCPRTTDLHFPVDIGSDYSGGVGMQVAQRPPLYAGVVLVLNCCLQRPTVLAPISRQPLVWSAVVSPFENQQSYAHPPQTIGTESLCVFWSFCAEFAVAQVPARERCGYVLRRARGGAGQAIPPSLCHPLAHTPLMLPQHRAACCA
jgi:hypothetical protein